MRPLIEPDDALARLASIFPRTAFDTTLSGDFAAWAIAASIYLEAVAEDEGDTTWTRPSAIIWLQVEVFATRRSEQDRAQWAAAATKSRKAVDALVTSWDISPGRRFEENSRETLRDEILSGLRDLGAVRQRSGLPTSSSSPRWALESHFADLFDPSLTGDELLAAVEYWTVTHLDAGARLKARLARDAADLPHQVTVRLPGIGAGERALEPSESSRILKGVIEEWAPRRLREPVVLSISEPGDKVHLADEKVLSALGVTIDVGKLLPDALLADVDTTPVEFWVIEAVATDGPITERRKRELLEWAEQHRIRPDSCRFLTAFASRGAGPAKRRLKDLATGSHVWFLDEPGSELYWGPIDDGSRHVIPLPMRPL